MSWPKQWKMGLGGFPEQKRKKNLLECHHLDCTGPSKHVLNRVRAEIPPFSSFILCLSCCVIERKSLWASVSSSVKRRQLHSS